ncbi:helix-turn-helix domain-containing protein [Bacillus norwichensis]|nr:helix-turn-helix transcriptional regulator [Bacillus norwichensis]
MADKIGVASSYLSAVENGKRNVPQEWIDKIAISYSLNALELAELNQAVQESQNTLKINFEGFSGEDKIIFMAMIKEFKGLNERDRAKIKEILLKNEESM